MKKIFYIILLISIPLQLLFAQDKIQSAGKIPIMKIKRPHTVVNLPDNPATIAYGYSSINSTTLSMPIPAGTPFTILAYWPAPVFASSMTKGIGGIYYLTEIGPPSRLYIFNPTSGTVTFMVNIMGLQGLDQPNGIAYNASNDMYYLAAGSLSPVSDNIYSLDINTGVATLIGSTGTGGMQIDLGITNDGICYSYDLVTNNAYTINLTTGVATLLGSLGFDPNYGQGMSIDNETGTVYLSAFNNGTVTGQLRTMNTSTGNTTLVTDWGFDQIAPFALDTQYGPPCPIGAPSNPDPPNGATNVSIYGRTLHWTNGNGALNIELWFGTLGNITKIYDGSAITSYALPTLFFDTTFLWQIACKNDTCTTWGPTWSFTTVQDPSLINETINVYPQNVNYWTGTCDSTSKTQISLVNTINPELGWMVFDLGSIVNTQAIVIDEIVFHGYLYANSWPYWAITPMGSVDPRTGTASEIYNQVSNNYQQGTAYSFNQESGTLTNGWIERTLEASANEDIKNSLAQNWFAIGIVEWDFNPSWYVEFQGWAEANKPYLRVTFRYCLSCLPPNPPTNLITQVILNPTPRVQLNWQDNSSNENGFKIYRKNGYPNDPGDYTNISTTFSNVTQFIDASVFADSTYTYTVCAFDAFFQSCSDTVTVTVSIPVGLEEILNDELPKEFSLSQNYPNPFNPSTKIKYEIPSVGTRDLVSIRLKVYDVLGNEVAKLVNEEQTAGSYEVEFDGSNLPSGIYFYQLQAGEFISVKKMILLK